MIKFERYLKAYRAENDILCQQAIALAAWCDGWKEECVDCFETDYRNMSANGFIAFGPQLKIIREKYGLPKQPITLKAETNGINEI